MTTWQKYAKLAEAERWAVILCWRDRILAHYPTLRAFTDDTPGVPYASLSRWINKGRRPSNESIALVETKLAWIEARYGTKRKAAPVDKPAHKGREKSVGDKNA